MKEPVYFGTYEEAEAYSVKRLHRIKGNAEIVGKRRYAIIICNKETLMGWE